MSDRPSDGMDIDELRDEFDWITEFQSRMAERIRGDADVHNLVDYVGKLEAENAKLREQLEGIVGRSFRTADKMSCLEAENAKLRELVRDLEVAFIHGPCYRWCEFKEPCNGDRCQYRDRMRELGVDA